MHHTRWYDNRWEDWLSYDEQWLKTLVLDDSNFGRETRLRFHAVSCPKLRGWIARREESMALARNKRTAMVMALHARLGAESVLRWCPVDILQHYVANLIY